MSLNRVFVAGVTVYDAAFANGLQAAWDPYACTWHGSTTNPTLGNGVLTTRWIRYGKTVWFRVALAAGTTTTVGSGTYTFDLPAAAHAAGEQSVSADFYDGANHYAASGLIAAGASVVNPFSTKGGTAGSLVGLGSTSFAAGTAALIVCQGVYEAA